MSNGQIIFRRRNRAIVSRCVSATWVIGLIEIQHQDAAGHFVYRAVDVTASAVGVDTAGRISEGNEKIVARGFCPMSPSETRGCRHFFPSGLQPGKPGLTDKIASKPFAPRWSGAHGGFGCSQRGKLLSNPYTPGDPFSAQKRVVGPGPTGKAAMIWSYLNIEHFPSDVKVAGRRIPMAPGPVGRVFDVASLLRRN